LGPPGVGTVSHHRPSSSCQEPVGDALAALGLLEGALDPLLVASTKDERKAIPRVRTGLPEAARVMVEVLKLRPELGAPVGFDGDGVTEDLDNVQLINPLIPRLKALVQRIEDSKLQWNAEAQAPTFAAYAIAKAAAKADGTLAQLLAPLEKVLANGPSREEVASDGEGAAAS
jgi:hypothetical protein